MDEEIEKRHEYEAKQASVYTGEGVNEHIGYKSAERRKIIHVPSRELCPTGFGTSFTSASRIPNKSELILTPVFGTKWRRPYRNERPSDWERERERERSDRRAGALARLSCLVWPRQHDCATPEESESEVPSLVSRRPSMSY